MFKRIVGWAWDNFHDIVTTALVLVGIAFLVAIVVFAASDPSISDRETNARCLERGYTSYHIAQDDPFGERVFYCSRLENGTERVVPLNGE